MHWKDICRDKNGSDVCDTDDACHQCIEEAARDWQRGAVLEMRGATKQKENE